MYKVTAQDKANGVTQDMIDVVYPRVEASGYAGTPIEPFISYIGNRKLVGNEWRTVGVSPYVTVDGRVKEMVKANAGQRYDLLTFSNPSESILPVKVLSHTGAAIELYCPPMAALAVYIDPLGGTHTGTAKMGGTAGAAKTNPYEDAETSAVGRALGLAGFGLIPGSGIASAEEVARARAVESKAEPCEDDGADMEGPHWIDDEATRNSFWSWARSTMGLSEKDVYTALHVASMHQYKGSKADAVAAIKAYTASKKKE